MDLDGDGKLDIISGSYNPGHLYFFRNTGDGYAKGEVLNHADGSPILMGQASTPFAFDWTGNGNLDLLVGDIRGNVWLVPGEGALKFATPYQLQFNGENINYSSCTQPIVADWDGDGIADLLVARSAGGVVWYRNTAKEGAPKLADPVELVGDSKRDYVSPGYRAKIHVADYTGDGRMDLLLGDRDSRVLPAPDLSEDDIKERDALQARQQAAVQKFSAISREVQASILKEMGRENTRGMTPEETAEYREAFTKAVADNEEYQAAMTEYREISSKMQRFRGERESRGNVWLFTRKAAAAPVAEGEEAAPSEGK